jgi:membrane fusion protein, heavy metal efflux system
MNTNPRPSLQWPMVAVVAIAFMAVGAGGAYLLIQRSASGRQPANLAGVAKPAPTATTQSSQGVGAQSAPAASDLPLPDVVVTMSQDAVKRAGLEIAEVATTSGASAVRIPGTIAPNGYQQVVVTPLISGRIMRVLVELGQQVRSGQTLAEVFSPELADAQTKYLSMKAELGAHERELDRTTNLVAIGAASQQELERLHAEHSAKLAEVQSLRSRLVLLGMPAAEIEDLSPGKDVETTTKIPAPIAGAITERTANVGLNVDTGSKLFTVVDLSSVWVVGALYERDFSRVHVGSLATVTTAAYPGVALKGRVSYIDPQVSAETRTAQVRVEVSNPRGELRLGMYADIEIAGAAAKGVTTIPKSAVQHVNDRQVVYLANPTEPGKFVEREVHLGDASGDRVEVISGLRPGDQVVSQGSFFVRAERERLGLRPAGGSEKAASGSTSASAARAPGADVQTAKIAVTEQGYEPSRLILRSGVPARLTFVRTTEKTCGTEVVFPSLNIRRALPLNQPVDIEFTPQQSGEIQFVCGMNMLRGTVLAQ